MKVFVLLSLAVSLMAKKGKKQVSKLMLVCKLRSRCADPGSHHPHETRKNHNETAHLYQYPDLQTF